MQYNGYEIQITGSSFIVRDSSGKFLIELSDEEDAKEFINELNEGNVTVSEVKEYTLYERFDKYTKHLKEKFYYEDKIATTNEKAIRRIAKSFEKSNNCKVDITAKYIGGEYIYIVNDVN